MQSHRVKTYESMARVSVLWSIGAPSWTHNGLEPHIKTIQLHESSSNPLQLCANIATGTTFEPNTGTITVITVANCRSFGWYNRFIATWYKTVLEETRSITLSHSDTSHSSVSDSRDTSPLHKRTTRPHSSILLGNRFSADEAQKHPKCIDNNFTHIEASRLSWNGVTRSQNDSYYETLVHVKARWLLEKSMWVHINPFWVPFRFLWL